VLVTKVVLEEVVVVAVVLEEVVIVAVLLEGPIVIVDNVVEEELELDGELLKEYVEAAWPGQLTTPFLAYKPNC
jgi:hypothetical protein